MDVFRVHDYYVIYERLRCVECKSLTSDRIGSLMYKLVQQKLYNFVVYYLFAILQILRFLLTINKVKLWTNSSAGCPFFLL